MKIEYETKILDVNVKEIERKLKKLKAKKIFNNSMRRYVYLPKEDDKLSWVRLRDNGNNITLAFKRIEEETKIDGTKEMEVEVEDFEKTHQILTLLGLKVKAYQENRRIHYELGNVFIEIDFWPKIPPYIEIEGKSKKEVEETVKKLGFKLEQTTPINTDSVFRKYGLDIYSFKRLTFNS